MESLYIESHKRPDLFYCWQKTDKYKQILCCDPSSSWLKSFWFLLLLSSISASWIKMIIKRRNEEPKELMNRNEINMLYATTPSLMKYCVFFKHLRTTMPCTFRCFFALINLGAQLHSPMHGEFCYACEQFTKWNQFQKYFSVLVQLH